MFENAEPKYMIEGPVLVRNFSDDFYYPANALQENLESVLIFAENTNKGTIPSGSVYTYGPGSRYDPQILLDDVGCGITAAVFDYLPCSESMRNEILRAVNSIGTHIGQGNHFIDVVDGSVFCDDNQDKTIVYLHSDFNPYRIIPRSLKEAQDREKEVVDTRKEYLLSLADKLGVSAEIWKDWTHNAVREKDDSLVYRKGVIDVTESDNVGVLAVDPLAGLYVYTSDWDQFDGLMQHGVGKSSIGSDAMPHVDKYTHGMAVGYDVEGFLRSSGEYLGLKNRPSLCEFLDLFAYEHRGVGFEFPWLFVRTKKH